MNRSKLVQMMIGAGALSVMAGTAFGQDADTQQAGTSGLEEIVVHASRMGATAKSIPNKIEIFNEEQVRLQQTLAATPTELLSNLVPSFAPTNQKMTGSGETFRGRTPLYLIDGVPQSTPLRPGAREGVTIDMEMVERVEVIFGANAIQGLGGTGGMINYITLSPPKGGEFQQRASVGLTTNDGFEGESFGWRGHYMAAKSFDQFDVMAAVSYEDRGLFYDADDRPVGIENGQGDVADSHSRNFFFKGGWEPGEHQRLQLMVSDFKLQQDGDYVRVDGNRLQGIPATSIRGKPVGDVPVNDVTTASLDYSNEAFLGGSLSAQAYYQDFKALYGAELQASFQDPAIAPIGTLYDQTQNDSEKHGARFTYGRKGLFGTPVDMVVGYDFLRDLTSQPLVLTHRVSVPPTTFYNNAGFLQLNYKPLHWLLLTGGARYENGELKVPSFITRAGNRPDWQTLQVTGGTRSFDDTLFNYGVVITPTESLSFYASSAEAYSMPDIGRVLRAVSTPGTTVDNLLDIAPIVTTNREVGGSYNFGIGEFRVAYFISESDFGQRLVARPDGTYDLARQATETSGWEFSVKLHPSSWLAMSAGYSLLDGEYDSNRDGRLDTDLGAADIGPNRLTLSVDLTPPGRYSGRIQSSTNFSRDFNNAAGARVARFEGYTTVDAMAAAQFGDTTLSLSISNLLDEQYMTYQAQAANLSNSLYYAGRGRTLTLRVSTSF